MQVRKTALKTSGGELPVVTGGAGDELLRDTASSMSISSAKEDKHGGMFITEVLRGGAAESDGRLQIGDEILSINGRPVAGMRPQAALTMLKVSSLDHLIGSSSDL